MLEKLYIETTVISYFASRPSRDLVRAAHQEITSEWWETILPKHDPYISPYVLAEISQGDKDASQKRLDAVRKFQVLNTGAEVESLAKKYFDELKIPDKAILDCFHLAVCALSGMDIIVSWNFKHIANPKTRKIFREINDSLNFVSPEICTPEEMLQGED